MKKYIAAIIIVALSLAGCVQLQTTASKVGGSISSWWAKPSTQQALAMAEQAATQFAMNAALVALQQYAGGGKVNMQQVAMQGGIATLYMQANGIRQLQGTSQVLDPVATAQILQQGGTTKEISQKLADELFQNATKLIQSGLTPDQAAEINAAAFDKLAATITAKTTDITK